MPWPRSTRRLPRPRPPPCPPTSRPASSGDDQIVIRIGDEAPIVIDLGDLGLPPELGDLSELGELGDLGDLEDLDFEQVQKCLGGSLLDLDLGAVPGSLPPLGGLDLFGDDVTLAGPDGVSVLDFGEGDGSVTITRENGELTITSEGDVDVQQLDEILDELPDEAPAERPLPPLPDFDTIRELPRAGRRRHRGMSAAARPRRLAATSCLATS